MFRLFLLLLCLATATLSAQETEKKAPEKIFSYDNGELLAGPMTGLQFSLAQAALFHERRMGTTGLAIRGELGVRANYFLGVSSSIIGPGFINPLKTGNVYTALESRYYYNLRGRSEQGKPTANNSGDFLGIIGRYDLPNSFIYRELEYEVAGSFTLNPRWGLRRQLGKTFDFEFALGLRTRFTPGPTDIALTTLGPTIDWRFGVRF